MRDLSPEMVVGDIGRLGGAHDEDEREFSSEGSNQVALDR